MGRKDTPCKMKAFTTLVSGKIDFIMDYNKKQGRALYNDKAVNPTREYNNYKHL